MCETQNDLLAEFVLRNADDSICVTCISSRSFIRNKISSKQLVSSEQSASEEEAQIDEELCKIYENLSIQNVTTKSEEQEQEGVSCYCSASHTDNLSTDEHESLREAHIRGIQQSDSGTDLTEQLIHDLNSDWNKFWSLNGEKLIWESWIDKYSQYINPEYKSNAKKFTFNDREVQSFSTQDTKKDKNLLLRTLSGSDEKISISEGWNPLSPFSGEDETEAERLINNSRCCSRTSSSLKTIDSITNVTRMTVSSLDLSNSTPSSDSFSSVSSVNSSVSSEDSEEDNQNQWNELWKQHYEDQYLEQYNKFIQSMVAVSNNNSNSNSDQTIQDTVDKQESSDSEDDSSDEDKTIFKEMVAMGLPTAFGPSKRVLNDSIIPNSNCDFNSGRNRIKAAFNLIGLEFHELNSECMTGEVIYKMKHIRKQNRHLKMRPETKAKHFIFDDEGNMSRVNALSDSSDHELSSCEEEVISPNNTTIEEEVPITKRKRRKKKPSLPPEIKSNNKLRKYWHKRFSLFSKFDLGVKLDEESWYSVTPELVAKNAAQRCKCDLIIDAFCGAGGNAIQFASECKKVIAIDIDPIKIELAKNNAQVYGVADKIEFIIGDFLQLADSIRGDVVFLSPPWGGPAYLKSAVYDLESMLQPVPYSQLMEAARKVTRNIAAFLPRNSNTFVLAKEAGPNGKVEIEQNFINKKLIAITAYYNDLIK